MMEPATSCSIPRLYSYVCGLTRLLATPVWLAVVLRVGTKLFSRVVASVMPVPVVWVSVPAMAFGAEVAALVTKLEK